MKPRHTWALGLAALAVAGAVIWLAMPEAPTRAPAEAVATRDQAPAAEAPRHSYRLRLRATTRVALTASGEAADGDGGVSGRVDLDGPLTLTELGPRRFLARLGPLDRADVTLLGATLPAGTLDGAAAVVDLDASGGIGAIAYDPATPAVARALLRTVLGEIGPLRYGASTPEAPTPMTRASMFGDGPLTEIATAAGGRLRERHGYDTLRFAPAGLGATPEAAGRWTLELGADGLLERLVGGERVTLRAGEAVVAEGRSQIALTRASSDLADANAVQQTSAAFVVDEPARNKQIGPSGERAALQQRAGDMTLARLIHDLGAYGDAGRMPRHDDWLWQASGWLKLHPEASDALVTEALRPERTLAARGLVLDLLANVGHAEAQAALRRLLDAPEVAGDAAWGELLQHLVLVPSPDPATLDWLGGHYADATEPDRRLAVAHVLGAAAGATARAGDLAGALVARAPLLTDLGAASDDTARVGLLDALGNAGLSEDADVMVAWTRAAAARGLRKMEGDAGRSALLGLVVDPSAAVAREAVRALSVQALGPEALDALRQLVDAGSLRAAAYGSLIGLTAHAHDADAEVIALLDAVASSARAPRDVRALAARRSALLVP